jgi:hypothetical protein
MAALPDGEDILYGHLAADDLHELAEPKTTAGVDRLGRATLFMSGAAAPAFVAIRWDGVPMDEIDSIDDGSGRTVKMFIILDPPTSGSAIEIEFSSPTAVGYVISSYNGVDQDVPVENTDTAIGSSTTPTITIASAPGDLVVDSMSAQAPSVTPDGDQTQEGDDVTDGSTYTGGASYEDGAASVELIWTIVSVPWAIIATSLRASSGGGGPAPFVTASSTPRFPRRMARLRG